MIPPGDGGGRRTRAASQPRPRRILIVDDDPETLLCLEQMVAFLGRHAVWATSATQALAAVDGVDAVLIDVHLPGMDGVALAHTLWRRRSRLPIAFSTASNRSTGLVRDAERLGRVLPKPCSLRELRTLLDDLLRPRLG